MWLEIYFASYNQFYSSTAVYKVMPANTECAWLNSVNWQKSAGFTDKFSLIFKHKSSWVKTLAHGHSPEDGREMLAENLGTV